MMNFLQRKLLESCSNKGLSVQQMYMSLEAQRDLCKKIMEHTDECFSRKVFKKSVMVTANYGGTQRTSREDVLFQLKEMDSQFLYSCTPSEITMFCNMVFWSLEEAVPSSMKFLHFFRKLIRFTLKYKDEVFFTNPITGFPVALKVREKESKDYVYKVYGKNVKVCLFKELQTTNKQKTTTSSVPSLIHSVDAAILSIIKSKLMDVDMSYIHDSISTHPNNIGKAKQAVYEALKLVYDTDVYQSIVDQLLEGIPEKDIPENLKKAPREDTWDVEEINDDNGWYAFS